MSPRWHTYNIRPVKHQWIIWLNIQHDDKIDDDGGELTDNEPGEWTSQPLTHTELHIHKTDRDYYITTPNWVPHPHLYSMTITYHINDTYPLVVVTQLQYDLGTTEYINLCSIHVTQTIQVHWNRNSSVEHIPWWWFWSATSFNGEIITWDVSNVEVMDYMFDSATSFNGDLS